MHTVLSNDEFISFHRNRPNYVAPSPTTLLFAYEDREFLKFAYQLTHESDVLKAKILEELNLKFQNADRVTLALLGSDLLTVLVRLFGHSDNNIRGRAVFAVSQVCSVNMGRRQVIEKHHLPAILAMIDDPVTGIRDHAYAAMLSLTEFLEGKDYALTIPILDKLIAKITAEPDHGILLRNLQLIKQLLEAGQGTETVLKLPSIERLTGLLEHPVPAVRNEACLNLASISYNELGKAEIISKGCIPKLIKGLKDSDPEVRKITTICLASLSQRNDGKKGILEQQRYSDVLALLSEKDRNTRLNCVQLITSLAENTVGRKEGEKALPRLEELRHDPELAGQKSYVEDAINVIRWKP